MKRKSQSSAQDDDEYEVENILDHCQLQEGKMYFLVKWKNYESDLSTWEPVENLSNSIIHLQTYRNILRPFQIRVNNNVFQLRQRFMPNQEVLAECAKHFLKSNELKYPIVSEQEVCDHLKILLQTPEDKWNVNFVSYVRKLVIIREFHIERLSQRHALKEWELEINKLDIDGAYITTENNVDLEKPPENFCYIVSNIPGKGVTFNSNDAVGCSCDDCGDDCNNCCGKRINNRFHYDDCGHLLCSPETPVIECNLNCRCKVSCKNRVTQRGRSVKLMIFRTSNGCGWGVKTRQFVEKGTFICEYVGLVITPQEANRRAWDDQYIFQLFGKPTYSIDSLNYGNVSHFFNHSCNPNSAAYAVWVNNSFFHKICLFSIRDIEIGEELTISYNLKQNNFAVKESVNALKDPKYACKCKSHNCKGYIF